MNYLVFALTDNYNLVSDLLAITNPVTKSSSLFSKNLVSFFLAIVFSFC